MILQYEYKVIEMEWMDINAVREELDYMGKKGWDLVTVNWNHPVRLAIFKRLVPQDV